MLVRLRRKGEEVAQAGIRGRVGEGAHALLAGVVGEVVDEEKSEVEDAELEHGDADLGLCFR